MVEHVNQSKKATTTSFSIPSLKHRIPGFGLESSQASPQAVPLEQPLNKPLPTTLVEYPCIIPKQNRQLGSLEISMNKKLTRSQIKLCL
ncbi:hypothetical protein [Nostoc sp.]|uniref:hypothetical protein n=1 Tax=Nostoc sp. TaxID=1180 RepID=UPI002FF890AC